MKRKPCIEEKKMKQLWTPWRIEYILGPKPDSCVFCLPESRDEDEERLVLYRGRHAFVIMNKFPYSNGHIMVCPYRHVMALAQLETDETHEIMDLMQRCTLVLQEHFHCEGINIGLNQGQAAGAGIRLKFTSCTFVEAAEHFIIFQTKHLDTDDQALHTRFLLHGRDGRGAHDPGTSAQQLCSSEAVFRQVLNTTAQRRRLCAI